jgi:hypothetical protein
MSNLCRFVPELIQYLKRKLGKGTHLKVGLALMNQHQESGLVDL